MRPGLLIAVLILAAPGLALASTSDDAEGMQAAFGNTIVSHYPDGHWVKHWFDRDGGYSASFWDGRRLTARWAREGDKVCLNNIRPRMILSRFCTPLVEAEVGESWPGRDPLGRRVRNELVAGR